MSGKIEGKVKQSVTPLADLDIEIKIEYQTIADEKRPVKTYKASPGYLAGVPSFNLSSNAPDRLVNIGQLIDITTKIIVKKMTLEGKLYVSSSIIVQEGHSVYNCWSENSYIMFCIINFF